LGAVDETDAAGTLRARVPDLSDATEERRRALATWVRGIYPGDDSSSVWTAGIQPDLLAERFAVRELAKAPALQSRFLVGLEEDQAERALTVIGRALNHSSEQAWPLLVSALRADPTKMLIPAMQVALITPADFDRAVGAVVTEMGERLPVTLREEMLEGVPRHEGAFRHTAAALARIVVAGERTKGNRVGLAGALLNMTNRLLAIGAYDDGVSAAEEAVRLRRRLYDEHPERQAAAFARALNGLSNALAKVSRLEEAVKAAEQLVHLREELYALDPETYRPTLAKGLNTLGNRLSELAASTHDVEHYTAAAAAFREAEDLYDSFSRTYDYDRANTLNNQARVLAPLNRHDEAMQRLQKAERLYRSMLVTAALEEVPSITVALARTLANLATLCSELMSEREEEARRVGLPAAKEAASYLEPLADAFPALYSAQVSNLRDVLDVLLSSPRSSGLTPEG
jgi:tetratricopeptide (TPR) repeat protein